MSEDQTPADLRRIAEVLNRHGVEYILIGGMAGRLHGATRATWDVDVVARPAEDNLGRLGAALRELRASIRGVAGLSEAVIAQQTHPEALARRQFGNWTTDAGQLDNSVRRRTSAQSFCGSSPPLDVSRPACRAVTANCVAG